MPKLCNCYMQSSYKIPPQALMPYTPTDTTACTDILPTMIPQTSFVPCYILQTSFMPWCHDLMQSDSISYFLHPHILHPLPFKCQEIRRDPRPGWGLGTRYNKVYIHVHTLSSVFGEVVAEELQRVVWSGSQQRLQHTLVQSEDALLLCVAGELWRNRQPLHLSRRNRCPVTKSPALFLGLK